MGIVSDGIEEKRDGCECAQTPASAGGCMQAFSYGTMKITYRKLQTGPFGTEKCA